MSEVLLVHVHLFSLLQEWEGFEAGPKLDKLGMRGSSTSELIFNNVRVPGEWVCIYVSGALYVHIGVQRCILQQSKITGSQCKKDKNKAVVCQESPALVKYTGEVFPVH